MYVNRGSTVVYHDIVWYGRIEVTRPTGRSSTSNKLCCNNYPCRDCRRRGRPKLRPASPRSGGRASSGSPPPALSCPSGAGIGRLSGRRCPTRWKSPSPSCSSLSVGCCCRGTAGTGSARLPRRTSASSEDRFRSMMTKNRPLLMICLLTRL